MPVFLLSLLSGLPGMIGKYFDSKAQIALAQSQTTIAEAGDNLQLGEADLTATSRKFKQRMMMILFIPFFLSIFWPSAANKIFDSLHNMPDFYIKECFLIFNTMFGITAGIGFTSAVFDSLNKYAALGHAARLEVEKIKSKL